MASMPFGDLKGARHTPGISVGSGTPPFDSSFDRSIPPTPSRVMSPGMPDFHDKESMAHANAQDNATMIYDNIQWGPPASSPGHTGCSDPVCVHDRAALLRSVLGNPQRPSVTFDRTIRPQVAHAPHIDANLHPRRLEHDLLSPPPKPAGAKPTDSQSLLKQISHTINQRESSTASSEQHGDSHSYLSQSSASMQRNGPDEGAIEDSLSATQASLEAHTDELQQLQGAYQQQEQQLNAVNQRLAEWWLSGGRLR